MDSVKSSERENRDSDVAPADVGYTMDRQQATGECTGVIDSVSKAVISDRGFLETVLTGLLARGHVLLEDVPGTGKTLTARSMATALGLSFSRIQFTPDLLPADVTGTYIFNEQDREFEFRPGPVFNNVVLADEINRAPPKTQSALLEAMEERQVSVDGDTHELPEPFFVIATQNPVEQEGTFALPEAQIDRFMVKTSLGYPEFDGELTLLKRRDDRSARSPTVDPVLSTDEVLTLQEVPESIRVDEDLMRYALEITRATRNDHRVAIGVSPRGSQRLFEAARARAVLDGEGFVTPDTIKRVAQPVLAHRLVLTADAQVNDIDKREIVEDVLDEIPVPTVG
jgi:MoxR-like ATPase